MLENIKQLSGQNRIDNKAIWDICGDGAPRDVLAKMNQCDYDPFILKKRLFVREASPIPFHPTVHPFIRACNKQNMPVVRLLIELGADPDAECCGYSSKSLLTPRMEYADNPQLQEVFDDGKLWWKTTCPEGKRQDSQDRLEQNILAGEASEALWDMLHSVRLSSPEILVTPVFETHGTAFKELVCSLGIPAERLTEFHTWLQENHADAEVTRILERVLTADDDDKAQDNIEKLFLSLELMGEKTADKLSMGTFDLPVQTGMLREFSRLYDASEHQDFIVKCVNLMCREILTKCLER